MTLTGLWQDTTETMLLIRCAVHVNRDQLIRCRTLLVISMLLTCRPFLLISAINSRLLVTSSSKFCATVPAAKSAKAAKKAPAKEHLNVGTIGHVDHGKTTLTSAITKYCHERHQGSKYVKFDDIDKAKEERIRGVTINASHIEYTTDRRHYAHTDCPGHADYIKNMICGTSQMDAAILVVAGSEGQMPQTREHVLLSRQIGLKQMVVYVNKCDLIDKDMKELVELEVRDLLSDHGFDGEKVPIVFGSALTALDPDPSVSQSELGEPSIAQLLDVMDTQLEAPKRDTSGPLALFFDSKVSIPGRGTVIIGTISRGTVSRGDAVEVIGHGEKMKTVVTDIHVFGKSTPVAIAGDHVGILVRGIKTNQLQRGMVLCKPDSLQMNNRFEASIYLLSEAEGGRRAPISTHYVQGLYCQTWVMGVRVDVPRSQGGLIMPGDHGVAHLTLARSMVMPDGTKFTIRQGSTTVISGVINKALPPLVEPSKFIKGKLKEKMTEEYGDPDEKKE